MCSANYCVQQSKLLHKAEPGRVSIYCIFYVAKGWENWMWKQQQLITTWLKFQTPERPWISTNIAGKEYTKKSILLSERHLISCIKLFSPFSSTGHTVWFSIPCPKRPQMKPQQTRPRENTLVHSPRINAPLPLKDRSPERGGDSSSKGYYQWLPCPAAAGRADLCTLRVLRRCRNCSWAQRRICK